MKSLKKTKPGILVVADDYGLGASKGIQAALAKLNVTPVATASYAPSDKDMSAQLLEIKDKGADSLILFGRPSDITLVLKQMGDLGIKLTTIGNTSIVAQTTLNNLSAAEADGNYAIGGMIPKPRPIRKFWIGQSACRTNTKCRPTTSPSPITTRSSC